jgi:hypothetical protein
MPYFVSDPKPFVSAECPRLTIEKAPERCPYCKIGIKGTRFEQVFAKMRFGAVPGGMVSETIIPLVPGCGSCASWFRTMRRLQFTFGFLALLSPFAAVFVSMAGYSDIVSMTVCLSTLFIWLFVTFTIKLSARSFKVVYFGDNEVVYSGSNKEYMEELAALNGLTCEKRAIFFRIS